MSDRAQARLDILKDRLQDFIDQLDHYNWDSDVSEHTSPEALVISCTRDGHTHRILVPYQGDAIDEVLGHFGSMSFDAVYHPNTPNVRDPAEGVEMVGQNELAELLVKWNMEVVPPKGNGLTISSKEGWPWLSVTSENPSHAVWLRLRQYKSERLARELIRERVEANKTELSDEVISSKAQGVAYLLRNADDYFQQSKGDSLNRRILSSYYGTMSLAQAEMLASPDGPETLAKVESYTTKGHGLYALGDPEGGFGDVEVGLLRNGFFSKWLGFLGHDVASFPNRRAKSASDIREGAEYGVGAHASMQQLLSTVPELGDLYLSVYDEAPSWVVPVDVDDYLSRAARRARISSAYIALFDPSERVTLEQLENADFAWVELESGVPHGHGPTKQEVFRARVDHPDGAHWSYSVPVHRSPFLRGFGRAIIMPTLATVHEHRVYAFAILYALSILVRYMPSTWREVEGGNADDHLALIEALLSYYDRLLPEAFLEEVIRQRVMVSTPGSFYS